MRFFPERSPPDAAARMAAGKPARADRQPTMKPAVLVRTPALAVQIIS